MAYEPTVWETGDIITAEKLNKIENGIANNGILIVRENDHALDKTWQEIHDAGFSILYDENNEQYIQVSCLYAQEVYEVSYWRFGDEFASSYTADSPSGYPSGVM